MNGRSLLAFAVLALAPARAFAQDLRQMRGLLEKRHAPEAQAGIDALVQGGGLTPTELAEAYEIQGLAFVALGDKPSAEGAFTTMLSIDPNRAPTGRFAVDASDALVSARTARGEAGALRIDAGMEERWRRGVAPIVSAGVYGDSAGIVARVDVYYRPNGQADYAVKTQQGAGPHRIELQLLAGMSPQPIEYYAEAFDDYGNQLVTRGTSTEPEHIDPTLLPDARGAPTPMPVTRPIVAQTSAPAPGPATADAPWQIRGEEPSAEPRDRGGITSKWWFWGGVGVVAIATIAIVVAASSSEPSTSGCFGQPCDATVGPAR